MTGPSGALRLVLRQAEDEGLWFQAETAAEAYLQAALRDLHAAVEQETAPQKQTEIRTSTDE